MDFAVIRARTDPLDRPFRIEAIHQFVSGHRHDFEVLDSCSIIGAINGLYSMGYTFIERQGHSNDWIDEVTEFSAPRFGPLLQRPDRHRRFRMSITLFRSRSTIPPSGNIFILPKGEAKVQGFTKQFAFAVSDHKNGPRIIAPTEFGDDNFHPFCTVVISHAAAHDSWLEKHRFWKREAWMENHHGLKELIEDFRLESVDDYHNKDDKGTAICRIFSRTVRATKMDAM